MKKRAQFPNAMTYTTLFRGLAKSQHPKLAVAEAVKQYNNLLKDSRLEPNTTHLNAVLNVCNRAGDLDSMFSIIDTVNDSTRAATAYTYSIIINALRWNTHADLKDLTDEQKEFNIKNALKRAKAIWGEAMAKWRQGRLVIDEELVSSMCRLMLMSSDIADKKEILDIVEQTMNIPNLSRVQERSAVEARKTDPSTGAVAKKDGNGVYATPGNNTLSLLLQVVLKTKQSSIGIKYWNFLVREYGIEPDRDCWVLVPTKATWRVQSAPTACRSPRLLIVCGCLTANFMTTSSVTPRSRRIKIMQLCIINSARSLRLLV
jgi:hypothetical protein